MEVWARVKNLSVHDSLQAFHIPFSHCAHFFHTTNNVLYIGIFAWLCKVNAELKNFGILEPFAAYEAGGRKVKSHVVSPSSMPSESLFGLHFAVGETLAPATTPSGTHHLWGSLGEI